MTPEILSSLLFKLIATLFVATWTTITTLVLSAFASSLINGEDLLLAGFGFTLYTLAASIVLVVAYGLFKLWSKP